MTDDYREDEVASTDPPNNAPITDGGDDGGGDAANDDESTDEETKHILVRAPESTYDSLSETKDDNGFTWLGMLLHAQRDLQRHSQRVEKCDNHASE